MPITHTEKSSAAHAAYAIARAAYTSASGSYETVRRAEATATDETAREALHAVRRDLSETLDKLDRSAQRAYDRYEEIIRYQNPAVTEADVSEALEVLDAL